ncbi:hypothetical protein [Tortoise microvirus 39]|nr:hypothetical protein [Tortoise microvirus 39]
MMIMEAHRAELKGEKQVQRANKYNRKLGRKLLRERLTTTDTTSTTGGVDVARMMADAAKAGFNPATWIGAGALSAYAKSTVKNRHTSQGHNAVAAYQMQQFVPFIPTAAPISHVQGAGEAVANGVNHALAGLTNELNRQDAMDFQAHMLGLQLGASAQNATMNRFGFPGLSSMLGGRAVAGGLGEVATPTAGRVEVTNPNSWWKVDPTIRDVAASEQREGSGGEIVEFGRWLTQRMNDAMYNITGLNRDQRYQRTLKWFQTVKDYAGGLSMTYDDKRTVETPLFIRVSPKQ